MTDEERIKLLQTAASSEETTSEQMQSAIREALKGLTPEELAEMGIV